MWSLATLSWLQGGCYVELNSVNLLKGVPCVLHVPNGSPDLLLVNHFFRTFGTYFLLWKLSTLPLNILSRSRIIQLVKMFNIIVIILIILLVITLLY